MTTKQVVHTNRLILLEARFWPAIMSNQCFILSHFDEVHEKRNLIWKFERSKPIYFVKKKTWQAIRFKPTILDFEIFDNRPTEQCSYIAWKFSHEEESYSTKRSSVTLSFGPMEFNSSMGPLDEPSHFVHRWFKHRAFTFQH